MAKKCLLIILYIRSLYIVIETETLPSVVSGCVPAEMETGFTPLGQLRRLRLVGLTTFGDKGYSIACSTLNLFSGVKMCRICPFRKMWIRIQPLKIS